jgi:hypothetical protein
MRSLFMTGIQGPRTTFWMGQQMAYVTTTPTQAAAKETNAWDVIAQGLKTGADVYGAYSGQQIAETQSDAQRAQAEILAAQQRTAQIMQQTQAISQQTMAQQNQVMGVDKTAFYMGAALLGLVTLGGLFYLLKD